MSDALGISLINTIERISGALLADKELNVSNKLSFSDKLILSDKLSLSQKNLVYPRKT